MRGKGRDQRSEGAVPSSSSCEEAFPSPCGEKVGINPLMLRTTNLGGSTFPSPCGEKVGINFCALSRGVTRVKQPVSVPLRGNGRDQHMRHCSIKYIPSWCVSVPLRGKGRDQLELDGGIIKPKEVNAKFPSPCGEKVGINALAISSASSGVRIQVSVPLRGKGRDQLRNYSGLGWFIRESFRPLAGKR